jgi:hypothetical protein
LAATSVRSVRVPAATGASTMVTISLYGRRSHATPSRSRWYMLTTVKALPTIPFARLSCQGGLQPLCLLHPARWNVKVLQATSTSTRLKRTKEQRRYLKERG